MNSSHPPFPFDQQCLVALIFLRVHSVLSVARGDEFDSFLGLASGCLATWSTAFLAANVSSLHISIVETGVVALALDPLAVATLIRARRS